jgi:hypothetical protein
MVVVMMMIGMRVMMIRMRVMRVMMTVEGEQQ